MSSQHTGCSKAVECPRPGQLSRYSRTREAFHTFQCVFALSPQIILLSCLMLRVSLRMVFRRVRCYSDAAQET